MADFWENDPTLAAGVSPASPDDAAGDWWKKDPTLPAGQALVGRDSVEPPPDVLASANPEQYYKPEDHPIAENVAKYIVNKIGLPTSLDDVKHEIDLLGLSQPTPFPAPRVETGSDASAPVQVAAGIANLPSDVWNFLTSPAGATIALATGGAGPLVQRAIALGFTADQIRSGLKANTLQDQVEALLGATLTGYAAVHGGEAKPKAADGSTESRPTSSTADFVPPATDEVISTPQPLTPSTSAEMRVGTAPVPESPTTGTNESPSSPVPTVPAQGESAGSTPAPAVSEPIVGDAVSVPGKQTASPTISDPGGFADSPLVSFIKNDVGGILSRTAARDKWGTDKYEQNKSLWDDAPAMRSPRHNIVYDPNGVPPDQAATAAADAGLLPQGADATTLWNALQQQSDAAHSLSAQIVAQRAAEQDAFKQHKAFAAAIEQPIRGEKPLTGAQLNVGDTVQIGTEHMKVTGIDPDTYDVTLEDGSKYGIQHVTDQQALYGRIQEPDAAALADRAMREVTFLPNEPATFDQFSASRGVSPTPPSFPELHRAPGGVSKQSAKAAAERVLAANAEWQSKRNQLRQEFEAMKASGAVREPTRIERLQTAASGSGPSAEAAQRLLTKFELAKPESVTEQRARFTAEDTKRSQREGIAAGLAKPLVGSVGDIGQGSLIPSEQGDIFGFGPGAASAAEPLSIGSQIKQLTNTIADDLRSARPAPMESRVQRAINAVGGKFVSVRESLGRAANTARATWLAIKNGYLRPPVEGEFKNAVKDWQGADQRTSFEVRNFAAKLRGEIKDPSVREAITNYIQADGNADLLRQRAAASNIKYRPGYEAALNLNDAQKTLAANVRQYFDAQLQDGINAGVLDHGLENYINQMWKRPNKFTQELQADLQAGKLQTNFQFARKRVFDSFFDGEQAGYAPASKDVSALVAAYDLSFNRSMAARGFVKALRDAKAADGEPVAKFSGMTQPIQHGDAPPEAYLIRSRSMPESAVAKDGRKYEIVDHPALRGWKFVVQDGAKAPAYFQADMLVHPDHAAALKNILGSSQFRSGKLSMITSPLLKAGAIAKQTKLSLSLFHLDQEGLHGLFHRVNPANLDRINFDDPKQWSLVRNGLQVADYSAMELFAEGLRGGGLVSKIPLLGKIQNAFNEFLFKDYIPRLKMTMALHAMERNVGRYPNLAPDVVAELTARQANAAFGELNYKLMARNPTFQDFLRLTVLAPDFLEARSRFIGQALKPYGREQQMALLLGGATMYVAARALNQWLDNDPHWGKPFSVVYNGREYRLRTVMGDVGEAFTDPRRFFYNRFSPWLKSGVTFGTGRDYRGIKLSNWEQVKDALSWLVPIPFGKQENASVAQRLLGSAGVSNKPAETAIDRTYKAALKFKEGLTDPKVQAEVKRAQQETYAQSDYSKVNRAILDGDKERATTEIVDLLKAGKDAATISKFYSNLPAKPFTGSQALEASWMRTMSPPERAQYNSARNQRINMSRTFFSLFGNALRQYRAEQNRQ